MRPEEGAISPAATLSRVDLPQPVGPTIATNSPSATSSVAHCTAVYVVSSASRNDTCTSLSETAGVAAGALEPAAMRSLCITVPGKLEHDPEKWKPVFGKDHVQSVSD